MLGTSVLQYIQMSKAPLFDLTALLLFKDRVGQDSKGYSNNQ